MAVSPSVYAVGMPSPHHHADPRAYCPRNWRMKASEACSASI